MGKAKIAQTLARADSHLGMTTLGKYSRNNLAIYVGLQIIVWVAL
jgi:hypothetical protein